MRITASNGNQNYLLEKDGKEVFKFFYNRWENRTIVNFHDQGIEIRKKESLGSGEDIFKNGEPAGWMEWRWIGLPKIHLYDEQNQKRRFEILSKGLFYKQFTLRSLDRNEDLFSLLRRSKWYAYNYVFDVDRHTHGMSETDTEELVIYALHVANCMIHSAA